MNRGVVTTTLRSEGPRQWRGYQKRERKGPESRSPSAQGLSQLRVTTLRGSQGNSTSLSVSSPPLTACWTLFCQDPNKSLIQVSLLGQKVITGNRWRADLRAKGGFFQTTLKPEVKCLKCLFFSIMSDIKKKKKR